MSNLINTFEFFLIGICIGSFLNVVIYRLPNNISVISPRSHCPKCKNTISWRENIPLLSWLLQKGRCASCNTKISLRYPIVELSTGLLFILFSNSNPYIYSLNGIYGVTVNNIQNIFSWILLCLLLIISAIDLKYFWIPQKLINFGLLFACLNLLFVQYTNSFNLTNLVIRFLVSSLCSYFLFEIIRISARYFYRREALGNGDSKLVAMMALWLGPLGISLSIATTYVVAAIFLLIALKLKLIKRNQFIPFAPFLSFGGLCVWFLGNQFIVEKIYM